MKRLLFMLLAAILLLSGCQPPAAAGPPDNFQLSLRFNINGGDCLDTYNNTFTKDLVIAGTETIDFAVPAEKMREIYTKFVEYNIAELPDDINAEALKTMGDLRRTATPAAQYVLTYTLGKETRTVSCDDAGLWDAEMGPPESYDALVKFVDFIAEYVYGTEEYKNMPVTEGGYA